jgi:hypothetical protein
VATPASRLLRQLDPLPFPARQRLLARTARSVGTTGGLEPLLDELSTQDSYGRLIALQLAGIARHVGYVRGGLDSTDVSLVLRAAPLAVRLGLPVAELSDRLPIMPQAVRHGVYRAVRRHRRADLADALLPVALERFGETEAAALLAAASDAVVRRYLPLLAYAVSNWSSFAWRHPEIFLDHVEGELNEHREAEWTSVIARVGAGLRATAASHPGRTLGMFARLAPITGLPGSLTDVLSALARHDPHQFLDILVTSRHPGHLRAGRALWRALLGLADDDLVRLMQVVGSAHLADFLRVVPPTRRAAVYSGVVGERNVVMSDRTLAALDRLPAQPRAEEARRLLAFHSVTDSPSTQLEVTARLPWAEAEPVLLEATHRPAADERAAAYRLYIRAAAATRDPDVVEQMTAAVNRLANEQDPVRAVALGAMAEVPPWLFGSGAAARRLGSLMRDAVIARDCSWSTQRAVQTLSDRLIREGAAADEPHLLEAGLLAKQGAADHLERLDLRGLDQALPRGAEDRVFAALRPRIVAEARLGRYTVALGLAAGLGRRAWRVSSLQDFLDQARKAADDGVVRRAIELWLDPPEERDQRVARVLRDDRSAITIGVVATAVATRRTDLLDDLLGRPIKGRFLRGVRYLPHFTERQFGRWLPRQLAAFRQLARDLAANSRATAQERARAISILAAIPGSSDAVRPFLASRDVQLVEAALAALASLAPTADAETTLAELLAYADTDRARVAVYAARRCARYVAPDQLRTHLDGLLAAGKVTARKEAVRLLADNHTPDCVGVLVRAWAAPDQHCDVRRAIVAALAGLLADDRSWLVLTEAGETPDVATAITGCSPYAIGERHRERYAALVHTVAGSSEVEAALAGLAALPLWARWDAGASAPLLVQRCTDIANTATWRPALQALVSGCAVTGNAGPLFDATRQLLASHVSGDRSEALNAAPDRDQPARQRLAALAAIADDATRTSPAMQAAVAALVELIAEQPLCIDVALGLAVATVPWDDADRRLEQLRQVVRIGGGTPFGDRLAALTGSSLSRAITTVDVDDLLVLADVLVDDASPPAGYAAVGIVEIAGRHVGWTEQWRARLRALRRYSEAGVQLLAAGVTTTRE